MCCLRSWHWRLSDGLCNHCLFVLHAFRGLKSTKESILLLCVHGSVHKDCSEQVITSLPCSVYCPDWAVRSFRIPFLCVRAHLLMLNVLRIISLCTSTHHTTWLCANFLIQGACVWTVASHSVLKPTMHLSQRGSPTNGIQIITQHLVWRCSPYHRVKREQCKQGRRAGSEWSWWGRYLEHVSETAHACHDGASSVVWDSLLNNGSSASSRLLTVRTLHR